jgi:hypothetical protein
MPGLLKYVAGGIRRCFSIRTKRKLQQKQHVPEESDDLLLRKETENVDTSYYRFEPTPLASEGSKKFLEVTMLEDALFYYFSIRKCSETHMDCLLIHRETGPHPNPKYLRISCYMRPEKRRGDGILSILVESTLSKSIVKLNNLALVMLKKMIKYHTTAFDVKSLFHPMRVKQIRFVFKPNQLEYDIFCNVKYAKWPAKKMRKTVAIYLVRHAFPTMVSWQFLQEKRKENEKQVRIEFTSISVAAEIT